MRDRLARSENRKWWTLAAVSFGLFMIMLDNTVVNVALPTIQRDLGAGLSELEWIVSGYALTFAALMLTGGKLADMFGRRRMFVTGLAVFAGSSLACALAPSAGFLIGARIVQGAGAALMNPAHALDHLGDLPAAPARHGDRHLGGRVGARARDRSAGGRAAQPARGLELDLLHQRADRARRDRRELPADRRVEGHDARPATRSAGPALIRHRAVRPHLRADRSQYLHAGDPRASSARSRSLPSR